MQQHYKEAASKRLVNSLTKQPPISLAGEIAQTARL